MARGVFDWIARESAARQHEEASSISLKIAQRISVALQRENARAVLSRIVEAEPQSSTLTGWDDAFHDLQ